VAVEASVGSAGVTSRFHTQFHVHASPPLGTTTVEPGRTTLTLMSFAPLVVALAVTASAVDELV
jgi:hypothetical protein